MKKNINVDLKTGITTVTDATTQEIAEANELNNINEQKRQEIENEKTAKANNKASGKIKLKNLGLNDDEIKALTGA